MAFLLDLDGLFALYIDVCYNCISSTSSKRTHLSSALIFLLACNNLIFHGSPDVYYENSFRNLVHVQVAASVPWTSTFFFHFHTSFAHALLYVQFHEKKRLLLNSKRCFKDMVFIFSCIIMTIKRIKKIHEL